MNLAERTDTFAAVDLGSNSFHLLVTRREHGEIRVIDRIKEMVRLGGGLDAEGRLNPDVQGPGIRLPGAFRPSASGASPPTTCAPSAPRPSGACATRTRS